MSGGRELHHDGLVCRAPLPREAFCSADNEYRYTLSLPAANEHDAIEFLRGLGGDAAGAGRAMRRIGIDAPRIRAQYKKEIETLVRGIAERLERGEAKEAVARWAVQERRNIVNRMRSGSGPVTRGIYEIRDWRKYGRGGRTYSNMVRHYQRRGVPRAEIPDKLLSGAQRSNPGVNAAVRGAAYLKHGGRVLLVVGVAAGAARIWNASDEELPRVIGEELGGFVGGGLGAGAGVGVCLIFGIATSGWGLLACGAVGGLAGGVGGSLVGGEIAEGIYYSDANTPADRIENVVVEIPVEQLYTHPPARMCVP